MWCSNIVRLFTLLGCLSGKCNHIRCTTHNGGATKRHGRRQSAACGTYGAEHSTLVVWSQHAGKVRCKHETDGGKRGCGIKLQNWNMLLLCTESSMALAKANIQLTPDDCITRASLLCAKKQKARTIFRCVASSHFCCSSAMIRLDNDKRSPLFYQRRLRADGQVQLLCMCKHLHPAITKP